MSAHVVPLRTHFVVFGALLALTAATVVATRFDLGPASTLVALAIAGAKGLLVALWFMHLRWSGRLTWIFAAAGLAWFALLVVLVFADVDTRAWLPI